MNKGDRIDGRWEIVGPAPGEPTVGRWRAVAVGTGEPAEILALQPASAWAKTAHGAFLDLHRSILRADDPALSFTEIGPLELKGFGEHVTVYRAANRASAAGH